MKVLVIGDTHCRTKWEEIVNKHIDNVNLTIFMGDYFDSYDNTDGQSAIDNFNKIISLRDNYNVKYLIGNHDTHYIYKGHMGLVCSRYQKDFADDYHVAFLQASEKLKTNFDEDLYITYKVDTDKKSTLFSHAGFNNYYLDYIKARGFFKDKDLLTTNKLSDFSLNEILYLSYAGYERGGHIAYGGPMWCDFNEYNTVDVPKNLTQVVGHSQKPSVSSINFTKLNSKVICYDFLEKFNTNNDYPILEL